jgi:hypothetical protein
MDDLGLNKWLLDTYGSTIEGLPLFRLIWSTNVTEKRYSEFTDFYGEIIIRTVTEVREVLKYPFAQDRWVIERICPVTREMKQAGLTDELYTYSELYVFQDKKGNFLPLTREMCEAAMYLFAKFFLQMSWQQRADFRMEQFAKREMERRRKMRELVGENQSSINIVLE